MLRKLALLALALMLALPSTAVATHMSQYMLFPTERDDQGRVDEPDRASTAVLGPTLTNCIASLTLGAACIPDALLPPKAAHSADVIAPGCSDEGGRQLSGLCGLHTVGVGNGNTGTVIAPGSEGAPLGLVSEPGRSDSLAPGRLTPTKASVVRFLDTRIGHQWTGAAGGTIYTDYDHKLRDAGALDALGGASGDAGQAFLLPGGTYLVTFYGLWQDKNGNGVVDFQGTGSCIEDPTVCGEDGGVAPTNEFVWVGKCRTFTGDAPPSNQAYCKPESVELPTWVYPGNHHGICFGIVVAQWCGSQNPLAWMELPGRQVLCFVDVVSSGSTPFACPGDTENIEDFGQEFAGDPLLDDQESVRVDWEMHDRTGDPDDGVRQWTFGVGWATFFYDQSLIVSTIMVTGATFQTARDTSIPHRYALNQLTSADVDVFQTYSPVLENLLQDTVKPAAREQWLLVRDSYAPFQAGRDALENNRLFNYDFCDTSGPFAGVCPGVPLGPLQGQVDDALFDPGYAREPNDPRDVYPGAVRGVCSAANGGAEATFRGSCNSYAGHRAGHRAYLESFQAGSGSIYTNLAWSPPGGQCIQCITSGPSGTPSLTAGYVRQPGDHTRVFQPGTHAFIGVVGAWRDRAQPHREEFFDVAASLEAGELVPVEIGYTVGPDGWVGDIVNTTGALRSRGYGPVSCNINGVVATREYAECNPYFDGNGGLPQSFSDREEFGGEFCFAKAGVGGISTQGWTVKLTPDTGSWSVPVFVWRDFDLWVIGNTAAIEEYTGTSTPIVLGAGIDAEFLQTKDIVIFPQGNVGLPITAETSGLVVVGADQRCPGLSEFVRDVDQYGPWLG